MSTYNGEKYLKEQIDSILFQELRKDIELQLLVRDDGSSDSTQAILDEYKQKKLLDWYSGINLKPAKSFWQLLKDAPLADYYAFADQDDVWLPNKIQTAINVLEKKNSEIPLLYCSNFYITDEQLNYDSKESNRRNSKYTDFAHSLIYSTAPGCTFVFNQEARKRMLQYDINENYELIHDWLAHKIVALLGDVYYDNNPTIYYRQHGNNSIGAEDNAAKDLWIKIKRFLHDKDNIRSKSAKSILNVYKGEINNSVKQRQLILVADYLNDKKIKKAFLREKAFMPSGMKKLYLKFLIGLNRV